MGKWSDTGFVEYLDDGVMKQSGMDWGGVERNGKIERAGVRLRGVEWDGMKRGGVEIGTLEWSGANCDGKEEEVMEW